MRKKLVRTGNSLALVLDKALLEEAKIRLRRLHCTSTAERHGRNFLVSRITSAIHEIDDPKSSKA